MARWLLKTGGPGSFFGPEAEEVTAMRFSLSSFGCCRRCGRVACAAPRLGLRGHLLRQRTDRDAGRSDRRKCAVRDGRAERRSPRPDPVLGRGRKLRLGRPDAGDSDGERRVAAALHALLGATVPTYGFSSTFDQCNGRAGSVPARSGGRRAPADQRRQLRGRSGLAPPSFSRRPSARSRSPCCRAAPPKR